GAAGALPRAGRRQHARRRRRDGLSLQSRPGAAVDHGRFPGLARRVALRRARQVPRGRRTGRAMNRIIATVIAGLVAAGVLGWLLMSALGSFLRSPAEPE